MVAFYLPRELDRSNGLQDAVEGATKNAGLLTRDDGDRRGIEKESRALLRLAWRAAANELPLKRGVKTFPVARRPRHAFDRGTPGGRIGGVACEQWREPIEAPGVLGDERPNPRKSWEINHIAYDGRRDRF
jgi:hypothetical protein